MGRARATGAPQAMTEHAPLDQPQADHRLQLSRPPAARPMAIYRQPRWLPTANNPGCHPPISPSACRHFQAAHQQFSMAASNCHCRSRELDL